MRALILLLALAACANPGRRYVGPLTPEQPSAQCRPATATLVLRGDSAVFTPDEGTWSLSGLVEDNRLQAERAAQGASRSATRGAARTDYMTAVDARWTAEGATATYTTPRCTFRATMTPR